MKPHNIFIARHGQSRGNVDKDIYKVQPDYTLELTQLGQQQAFEAGSRIRDLICFDDTVAMYVSPFYRTRQTAFHMKKSLNVFSSTEDVRLREQEWGQHISGEYNENHEILREQYGHFYWRFPNGESCADVYDRVSDFLNTLHRDFEKNLYPRNVVIVTHGMTMRVLLMRWFHMTVEEFELLANPSNCDFYHLQLVGNKYQIINDVRKYDQCKHQYVYKDG